MVKKKSTNIVLNKKVSEIPSFLVIILRIFTVFGLHIIIVILFSPKEKIG